MTPAHHTRTPTRPTHPRNAAARRAHYDTGSLPLPTPHRFVPWFTCSSLRFARFPDYYRDEFHVGSTPIRTTIGCYAFADDYAHPVRSTDPARLTRFAGFAFPGFGSDWNVFITTVDPTFKRFPLSNRTDRTAIPLRTGDASAALAGRAFRTTLRDHTTTGRQHFNADVAPALLRGI